MTLASFSLLALGLLAAPGPTNALMAMAGAEAGVRRVLRLIPVVLAGYLLVALPLAFLGTGVVAHWPLLALAVRMAAAVWVLLLAVRLRRMGARAGASAVTARSLFITTLLNPKGLVIGLVLLPSPSTPLFVPALAVLAACIAGVVTAWGLAGHLIGRAGGRGAVLVQRLGSVALAAIAITLLLGLLRG